MSKKEKQETKTGKKKIKTWQIVTAVFAVILLALLVNIVKQSMGAAAAGTPGHAGIFPQAESFLSGKQPVLGR